MRLSLTLSTYIGRQFLMNFVVLLSIILMIVALFDVIELLRRSHGQPEISLGQVIELAILKLPYMGQQVFPFAALFGGMLTFWRLARHQELVITRASGISAWQFLLPVILAALGLGLVQTGAINPVSSASLSRYEQVESLLFKGQQNLLAVSSGGIWLRQSNELGHSVIYAARLGSGNRQVQLDDVTVFIYDGPDSFLERLDAKSATLEDGYWRLDESIRRQPEMPPEPEAVTWLETDLTLNSIQDSFAPPQTMSFWTLSAFIEKLETSGFSALRHRLYLHSLLSNPLLMCAMVLIAATFTLRHGGRRGGVAYVVAGGILTGFVLYFFSDLMFALGRSESIPVTLAAWTPSGVATLLGLTTLLHLEDG